jgi:glycine cleavage system H protein
MNVPQGLLYTKDHEWARIEGKNAYVGITDYAQHSLGDITFVGLPKSGEALVKSKFCATVESVKAASDVYAPLSGTVVSINQELSAHPEAINQSPYDKGYFFLMQIKDVNEKTGLMDAQAYSQYIESLDK